MSAVSRWREVPLLQVCKLNPRHSLPADELSVDYVDYAGIDDETGEILNTNQRLLADVPEGTAMFCQGDVLFAGVTSGRWISAVVGDLPQGVGFGPQMSVLRPGPQLSAHYLWHFFQQPWLRQLAARSNTSTRSQPTLSHGFFRNLHIALPSIDEQRYIVDALEQASVRPYREAVNRAHHLKRELTTRLMLPPAGTTGPGWALLTLADIVWINPHDDGAKAGYAADTEVAFFAHRDLLMSHLRPTLVRLHDMPNPGREVRTGDLLLGAHPDRVTYGQVGVVPKGDMPKFASRTLTVLRPKDEVCADYLASLFRSAWFGLTVTTERPLVEKYLGRMKVALPTRAEQRRILGILDAVPVTALAQAKKKSRVLYHAIARDAFDGKLSARWRAPSPPYVALSVPDDEIDASEVSPVLSSAFRRAYRTTATEQLSLLQRLVWRGLRGRRQALIVDDPESFDAFCTSHALNPLHEYVSPSQIRRTLEQLCALGLIQHISLPPRGQGDAAPYLAAFRAYRQSADGHVKDGLASRDAKALRASILEAELGL
ncbi:hypothetical protein [Pseudomonas sp. S3E17]|uniref:hypothetical protein n=1 Tax=Pseudomonas sp. S3E17 TaxID=2817893 RepID=UPI00209FFC07|nr:hypothetical protein [Pseudomonas sp. S3E17]MCP1463128.1 type I restriction enzyme S subunit [Pseudomonas sp. S3E17]